MKMDTYTGRKFDPLRITADDIVLEDIAHALSLLCRGGGHITRFYSVGQHCINCFREARARGWSEKMQLACLIHDASEAYISDIVRPVKRHLSNYLEIEQMIMEKAAEKFGLEDLTEEEKRKWKQIDDEILEHELFALMPGHQDANLPKLCSQPDLSEKPWRDVETEFLRIAAALIKRDA